MTRSLRPLAMLVGLSLLLSACAQITLVEPKRHKIGEAFSVEAQIAWSRLPAGKSEVWTVDGTRLQAIRFYKGIEDEEALFETRGDLKLPVFRADMTANDIMEFVVDSYSRLGASQVEARGLRPDDFGEAPGFRFEFGFLDPDGLEAEGMASGAVIEERLYLILYTGSRAHYFPKHKNDVEKLLDSVETI